MARLVVSRKWRDGKLTPRAANNRPYITTPIREFWIPNKGVRRMLAEHHWLAPHEMELLIA